MKIRLPALLILFLSVVTQSFGQANCGAASSGFTPINDLGTGTFTNAWGQVWTGGLYPNGSNYLPAAHKNDGMQIAQTVLPLDTTGAIDTTNGKIVWLSIGMSHCTFETQKFIPLAYAYPNLNPKLVLVDGAQSGKKLSNISAPWNNAYSAYWSLVASRLSNAGVTANQVEVIWLKEANSADDYPLIHDHYDSLIVGFKRVMHELKTRFPNAKLCYMPGRSSGRYASSTLNPEPFSYYTGWATKEIIEDQINGDTALAYSGNNIRAPFLLWSTYLWSDGSTPQVTNPNIFITCPDDLEADGTHPSDPVGRTKIANWLLTFYENDSLSCPWFFKPSFCSPVTDVNNISSIENTISIFPDPFSTQTILHTNIPLNNATLTVYNSLGRKVKEKQNISGQKITLQRDNLPCGLYFILVKQDNKIFSADRLVISDN